MDKEQMLQLCKALLRVMARFKIDTIETRDGSIIFYGPDGKSMGSFVSLDVASDQPVGLGHRR